jgi:tight adherence protein C
MSALLHMFSDSAMLLLTMLVFLAAATLTFTIMAAMRARGAIKRRAAGISEYGFDGKSDHSRSLRHSGLKAAKKLIEYSTKHYQATDNKDVKVLRRRLLQAGYFDPRATAYFFLARTVLAVLLAGAAVLGLPMLGINGSTSFWLFVGAAGLGGYVGPSIYVDKRIAARKREYQAGFPDFMDLLVVCADAGLAMEAALDRVGRELGDSYPAMCSNIHMANLEIRAGRRMTEALEHLAERLGLEEARSFTTLIQQSEELGSSITDALRVYSDDMRHKRLSHAEEKAYALPAKLALPMMVCIFPTLFVVILLPVIVRLTYGDF